MKYIKYFEFVENDFEPIKSFYLKDELNPKVWDDNSMKTDIRQQLLEIAQDFYTTTELTTEIKDIVLTGSLANYNWSENFSDYDVHILIDFSEVNSDIELVRNLVNSLKNIWNRQYDIFIEGYEVELYIQDVNELHRSSAIYSILEDKWNIKPYKIDFTPDEDEIREKAESIMISIDDLENRVYKEKYETFIDDAKKVWKKIKKFRSEGLESEDSEFSTGNLTFKFLRRNGYIGKLLNLRRLSYQNQFK